MSILSSCPATSLNFFAFLGEEEGLQGSQQGLHSFSLSMGQPFSSKPLSRRYSMYFFSLTYSRSVAYFLKSSLLRSFLSHSSK